MIRDMTASRPCNEPPERVMACCVAVPRPPRREPESLAPPKAIKWAKAALLSLLIAGCAPRPCAYNDLYIGQVFTVDEEVMYHTFERRAWVWWCEQHHANHVVSVSDSSTIVGVWSW